MSKISLREAEALFNKNYWGKYVQLTLPGYSPVVGRIDSTSIDTSKDEPMAVIMINDHRYTMSVTVIKECITFLNKKDGNL